MTIFEIEKLLLPHARDHLYKWISEQVDIVRSDITPFKLILNKTNTGNVLAKLQKQSQSPKFAEKANQRKSILRGVTASALIHNTSEQEKAEKLSALAVECGSSELSRQPLDTSLQVYEDLRMLEPDLPRRLYQDKIFGG